MNMWKKGTFYVIISYMLVEEEMKMDEPPDRSCYVGARWLMGITVSTMFRQIQILLLRSIADAADTVPSVYQLC